MTATRAIPVPVCRCGSAITLAMVAVVYAAAATGCRAVLSVVPAASRGDLCAAVPSMLPTMQFSRDDAAGFQRWRAARGSWALMYRTTYYMQHMSVGAFRRQPRAADMQTDLFR